MRVATSGITLTPSRISLRASGLLAQIKAEHLTISTRPLSSRLLVISNTRYIFDDKGRPKGNPLEIVREVTLGNFGKLYITRIGALGFEFDSAGSLASIEILESRQNGEVHRDVMANHDNVVLLQVRRIEFVNFVSSVLFGRISPILHSPLVGAAFARLDDIFGFGKRNGALVSGGSEAAILRRKVEEKLADLHPLIFLTDTIIDNAIEFLVDVLERSKEFEYVDLQSTLVMNYQAAILHQQQHATASLAINIAVAECLVKEIFYSYGIVGDRKARQFATASHKVEHVSDAQFKKMVLAQQLQRLRDGNLISSHLFERIDAARLARNSLMHSGSLVTPRQSGECQTIVRDLWAFLINPPFELNSGWTYRF